MNRRKFLQATTAGSAIIPTLARAQGNGGRELVVHTVHEGLRQSSPLLIYSGLKTTAVTDPLLLEAAAGGDVSAEVWDDWNDYDLRRVFGAFVIASRDQPLGSYRIFDTPDLAHADHQPMVDEAEQGYVDVGGMRASRIVAGSLAFASMRLWNVVVTGAAPEEGRLADVVLGMVKHLGRSIRAIE